MLPRLATVLALGIFAAPAAAQPPAAKPRPLKVRVEVAKNIAKYFTVKDRKLLVTNGAELTFVRGWDIELMAVDFPNNLRSEKFKDRKPGADIVLQLMMEGEFPAALANEPNPRNPQGIHRPMSSFYYRWYAAGVGPKKENLGLGSGSFTGVTHSKEFPGPAEWEKARLNGLAQLDAVLRKQISYVQELPAIQVHHEKPGWYLENPYPFVFSGTAEVYAPGEKRPLVRFRLVPGSGRVWIAEHRFGIRDVAFSAPDPPRK